MSDMSDTIGLEVPMNMTDRLSALRAEASTHGEDDIVEMVDRIESRQVRLYDIQTNEEIQPEPGDLVVWCKAVIDSLDSSEPTGAARYRDRTVYAWGSRDTLPCPEPSWMVVP